MNSFTDRTDRRPFTGIENNKPSITLPDQKDYKDTKEPVIVINNSNKTSSKTQMYAIKFISENLNKHVASNKK